MPPLPEGILLGLAPFAPLFSQRLWGHAQVLLLGAILTPGARTVTSALRVMGLAAERRFTNDHRVLNRASWSARQGSRILLGLLITLFVPPGATIVLGADDTVERRSGRKIKVKGCYRDAVRSSHTHVIRCFGLTWVSMMLLVPVPWSRRLWALPFLTALCWPANQPGQRRHNSHSAPFFRGAHPILKVLQSQMKGKRTGLDSHLCLRGDVSLLQNVSQPAHLVLPFQGVWS
jgi:DDE superfamily endonuclease